MAALLHSKSTGHDMGKGSVDVSMPLWDYFDIDSMQIKAEILTDLRELCKKRVTVLHKLRKKMRRALEKCHVFKTSSPKNSAKAWAVLEELWDVADDLCEVDRQMETADWPKSQIERAKNLKLLRKEILSTLRSMCGLPLEQLVQCDHRSADLISALKLVKALVKSIQTSINKDTFPNGRDVIDFISRISNIDQQNKLQICDWSNNMQNSLCCSNLVYEDVFQIFTENICVHPNIVKNRYSYSGEYLEDIWNTYPVFILTARSLSSTLLHFKISRLDLDCIDYSALGAKVAARGWFNRSILHLWHRVTTVRQLVEDHAADMDAVDSFGRTPLMYAVLSSDCHCRLPSKLHSLLEIVIPSDKEVYLGFCSCTDHAAQIVDLLADHGADLKLRDQDGVSVIHLAAMSHPKLLDILLCYCTLNDMGSMLDNSGASPLHYAVFGNNIKAVEMLLNFGVDAHIRDKNGNTALEVAEQFGLSELSEMLRTQMNISLMNHSGMFQVESRVKTELWLPFRIRSPEPTEDMCRGITMIGPQVMLSKYEALNESDFDSILNSPLIGGMQLEEAELIEAEVTSLVERLSQGIQNSNPEFSFTPKLSGSSVEGTNMGFPNEFDFMLIMLNIRDPLDLEMTARADYTIDDCFIEIERGSNGEDCILFYCAISAMIVNVLNHVHVWSSTKLKMGGLRIGKVGPVLTLYWNGKSYKHLKISVHLMPSFPIRNPPFIPLEFPIPVDFSGCELHHVIIENRQVVSSYSDMENVLMKLLPAAAIEAYKLSKAMRSIYISKFLVYDDNSKQALYAERASSFRLKNLLLLEYSKVIVKGIDEQSITRREWLERMFRRWRDSCAGKDLLHSVCGGEPLEPLLTRRWPERCCEWD